MRLEINIDQQNLAKQSAELSDIGAMPERIRNRVLEYELLFAETAGLRGAQILQYCETQKSRYRYIRISAPTFYRNRALFYKYGRGGVVPAWGSAGKSTITAEQFAYFKNLYLKENGPSAEKCRLITFGKFKIENPALALDGFPSAKAFVRKTREVVGDSYIDLARRGERYYKRTHEYHIARDWSGISAGDWWVSDHHQLDVLCTDLYGVHVRPWATVWMDLRTDKFVSSWLHPESPNSDHIFMTLAWAVEKYGLPVGAYLDNGKDYRCLDLTGNPKRYRYWDDKTEQAAKCLFNTFDIKVLFAREYNAQAKPIEPRFKQVIAGFSKLLPGYTGSNSATRPDSIKSTISSGKLLSFDDVQKMFDDYVDNIYNKTASNGNLLGGLSPDQAWDKYRSSIIRRPSEASMRLLYMRGQETVIGRRGITEKLNGVELSWWADAFYTLRGMRVYVKRDMHKYNQAYVHKADTGEFLCVAYMDSRMPGIVTDIDKTELREAIRRKNKDMRLARAAISVAGLDAREILENEKTAVAAISGENQMPPAAATEIIVTTDFDRIRNDLRDKETAPPVDLSEITPDAPPRVDDEIDVWGLKSVNAY